MRRSTSKLYLLFDCFSTFPEALKPEASGGGIIGQTLGLAQFVIALLHSEALEVQVNSSVA